MSRTQPEEGRGAERPRFYDSTGAVAWSPWGPWGALSQTRQQIFHQLGWPLPQTGGGQADQAREAFSGKFFPTACPHMCLKKAASQRWVLVGERGCDVSLENLWIWGSRKRLLKVFASQERLGKWGGVLLGAAKKQGRCTEQAPRGRDSWRRQAGAGQGYQ